MNKRIKKIISTTLALVMSAAISISPVFAEQPAPSSPTTYENGTYTSKINYYKDKTTDFVYKNTSICNSLFVREADVKLTDENCIVDTYVVFPVPNYKNEGKDGTITNVRLTYNNQEYLGVSDIKTKAEKKFTEIAKTAGFMFGVYEGKVYPTQKITFTLPREAIYELEKGLNIVAYVAVSMKKDMPFIVRLSDVSKVSSPEPEPEPQEPTVESKDITISASIKAPKPTYTVNIPPSVNLGTLSRDTNNEYQYDVKITAENMGQGHIEVTAPKEGELQTKDGKKMKFSNSIQADNIQGTTTVKGTFTVLGEDVKSATAGDYTGSTQFTIKYIAE